MFVILLLTSMVLTGPCFLLNDSLVNATQSSITYLTVTPSVIVSNEVGETFNIYVNIFNVEDLHAFQFKLGYNTTLLDTVNVTQGAFFPPPPNSSINRLETDEINGLVWLNMSLADSVASRNGDGTLASITLNVTLAPDPTMKSCCVLDLQDSILYDSTMTPIPHDHTDGLYFWKSILDDPDEGRLLDLTTQKGGAGQGLPSPSFSLGDTVILRAHLTFNEDPVPNQLVSFQVLDANNSTVLTRTQFSDSNGVATIDFQINMSLVNLGTWKAIANSVIAKETVWDQLQFRVTIPVGGHATPIRKVGSVTLQGELFPVILLVFGALIIGVTEIHAFQQKRRGENQEVEVAR